MEFLINKIRLNEEYNIPFGNQSIFKYNSEDLNFLKEVLIRNINSSSRETRETVYNTISLLTPCMKQELLNHLESSKLTDVGLLKHLLKNEVPVSPKIENSFLSQILKTINYTFKQLKSYFKLPRFGKRRSLHLKRYYAEDKVINNFAKNYLKDYSAYHPVLIRSSHNHGETLRRTKN